MRPYEVMIIFDVEREEPDIRQQVERMLELVRSRGGNPGQVEFWGRRTFAYELKHRNEGFYVLVEATAEPATMAEVDRLLALEDSVLRYKILRQPEKLAGRKSSGRTRGRTAGDASASEASEASEAPRDDEVSREQAAS
jgi:small subunit ribosomal protein S6